MSPKTLLVALFLVGFASCGSMPPPPEGDLCVVDVPRNRCVCFPIDGAVAEGKIRSATDLKYTNVVRLANGGYQIPLSQCHKYTAFSPKHWENYRNYVDALYRKAERCIQRPQSEFDLE